MGRTLSLLGVVMFTVGVVALSSLARRNQGFALAAPRRQTPPQPPRATEICGRQFIPAFAYDAPFSLN